MKVLMTADTVGGVFTYAVELSRELGRHGVEVALATQGRAPSAQQRGQLRQLANVELFESSYKLEWMEDPWFDVAEAGQWLRDLETRLRPELVHLNDFSHGALPWSAPRVVVGHSCVLSWWKAVKGEVAPAHWNTYRERVTGGLRSADAVVAPTSAMLQALVECYGALPRCEVIHNGLSQSAFAPLAKEPLILSAGRLWDPAKNMAALEAVAGDVPWPIYLAGDLRAPDGTEGEPMRCVALGSLLPSELAQWLARASIYALPARYEPFGLSVLEAALAGCALVLGDIASLRELWDGAALFVPPQDHGALTDALRKLISDVPLRRTLSSAGRQRALGMGSGAMARAYLDLYGSLSRARDDRPSCAS